MKQVWIALITVSLSIPAVAGGISGYGSYWDTEDASDGYGAGAKLNVTFAGPIELELRGGYFPDLSEDIPGGDLDLEVIPIEAGLIFRLPVADAAVSPYGGGGVGYYMLELEAEGPGGSATLDLDDEVGWYLVGGLTIHLSDTLAIFAEGKYTTIEGTAENDDLDLIEDEFDIDLGGIGANAGLTLLW